MTFKAGILAAGLGMMSVWGTTALAQDETLTLSAEAQAVFDLAADLYPELFTDGTELREADGYTYRFFASSGIYVGVKDGSIYLMGGPFGSSPTSKGAINDLLMVLEETAADVEVTPTVEMETMFDLAAEFQPALFTGGTEFATDAQGFLYRYFADSGVYAAIKDGLVYLKGGAFGTVYTSRGALNTVIAALDEAVNDNPNPNPIPEGDFTLTVSGTVSVSGISAPVNFVIEDMPAPASLDLAAIEDVFQDSVEEVPGLVITNTSFVVVNNTADHIEFTMSVSATITQGAVSIPYVYDLRYNYVR